MQALSQEYVDHCPEIRGFRQRGLDMTRLEVFIDAAFAFAVTLLVISFDQIPANYEEMVLALKGIPAFVVAVAQLVWIWHEHNVWSRRFGLDDTMTVLLSATLLIIMLVYIYPLRVMAQGMFSWFTDGFLPANFSMQSVDDLRFMFVFLGLGFAALCAVFYALYGWARHRARPLRLSAPETHETRTLEIIWIGCSLIGIVSALLALSLPARWVPFAGFAYFALSAWGPLVAHRRARNRPAPG